MLAAGAGRVGQHAGRRGGPRPTLAWNFVGGAMPAGLTVARGTNATVVGPDGLMRWAPANLWLWSQDASPAYWEALGGATKQMGQPDPFGGNQAVLVTHNGGRVDNIQSLNIPAGVPITVSAWVRYDVPGTVGVSTQAGVVKQVPVTTSWTRVSATFAASPTAYSWVYPVYASGSTIPAVYIYGVQVEYGNTMQAYNPTSGTPYYGPRFDYDPATKAPLGLLIEEQRQNLATGTLDLRTAAEGGPSSWFSGGTSYVGTDTTPMGEVAAAVFNLDAAGHNRRQVVTVSAGTAYTFSFYAKRGTAADLKYSVYDATNSADIVASTSYYAQTRPNAWVRVAVNFTAPASCVSVNIYPLRDSGVTGTVSLWGAQLETGLTSVATSFIPTFGASAIRAREDLTAPLGAWLNKDEGTFISEGNVANASTDLRFFLLRTSGSGRYGHRRLVTNFTQLLANNADLSVASVNTAGAGTGLARMASSYKTGQVLSASFNGGATADGTLAFTMDPAVDNLALGSDGGGFVFLNGHLRSLIYLPVAQRALLPTLSNQLAPAPSLDLDFTQEGALPAGVAFTRSGGGGRTNAQGLFEWVAADNTPRWDYDPATRAPRGVLIEEPRTNLWPYSGQINQAPLKVRLSVVPGAAAAPDGTLSADYVLEDSSNNSHYLARQLTKPATSAAYTGSVYCKAGARNWVRLVLGNTANTSYVNAFYDLATGSIGASFYGGAGFSGMSVGMVDAGNGWWRCIISGVTDTDTVVRLDLYNSSANNVVTYPGDGVSGYYAWGAQVEAGASASTYIPTGASTATRYAEACSALTTGLLSPTLGTLVAEGVVAPLSGTAQYLAALDDGTLGNLLALYRSTGSAMGSYLVAGGAQQHDQTALPNAAAGAVKVAISYAAGGATRAHAGAAPVALAAGTVPLTTKLVIGNRSDGQRPWMGSVRRVTVYPFTLPSRVQGLTA